MAIRKKITPKLVATASAAVLLGGCAYFAAANFQRDSRSGVEGQQITRIFLAGDDITSLSDPSSPASSVSLPDVLPDNSPIYSLCRGDEIQGFLPAIIAAVAGFAVQQTLSYVADYLADEIQEVQEAGTSRYHAGRLRVIPREFLSDAKCLILVRAPAVEISSESAADGSQTPQGSEPLCPDVTSSRPALADGARGYSPGLVVALRIETQEVLGNRLPQYFSLRPVYACMNSSVAQTGDGEPVSLSVAFAGSVARSSSGARRPVVETISEATFDFSRMTYGVPVPQSGLEGQTTPILAAPARSDAIFEISVGVVETGSAVPDAIAARASIEALAEALGGAISSEITDELDGDE